MAERRRAVGLREVGRWFRVRCNAKASLRLLYVLGKVGIVENSREEEKERRRKVK